MDKGLSPLKTVLIVTAAFTALPIITYKCNAMLNDELPDIQGPLATCAYTPDASVRTAQYALDQTDGDAIEAVGRASALIEEYYGDKCEATLVEDAQQSAVDWIKENSNRYTPKNLPVFVDPMALPEIVGTVECSDRDGDGTREIYYRTGGAPKVSNIPFGLWEDNTCTVEAGDTQVVKVSNTELVKIVGR